MNKFIAILSLVVGMFVFGAAVHIATPTSKLRTTQDSAISSNYEAPVAGFLGTIPKSAKGLAHNSIATKRVVADMKLAANDTVDDGLVFGEFSTLAAMNYHARDVHTVAVPNPKAVSVGVSWRRAVDRDWNRGRISCKDLR